MRENRIRMQGAVVFAAVMAFALAGIFPAAAEDPKGPPPAVVETALARAGEMEPVSEFVGTLEFPHVANVAAEVSGKATKVLFEEGDRVRRGDILVTLSDDILETAIKEVRASREALMADIARAEKEYGRISNLFEKEAIAESVYDDTRFKLDAIRSRVAALDAQVEKLLVEQSKKKVPAPFDGVVLERDVHPGEWVTPGSRICRLARDSLVEAVVHVPAAVAHTVTLGAKAEVKVSGGRFPGTIIAVIPQGDAATRTFPVRIRLSGAEGFLAGSEALASLPTGPKTTAILVPRDAVVNLFGSESVVVVKDGKAVPIPVSVIGNQGFFTGVAAEGLSDGDEVIIKGNERVRPGQPVSVKPGD